jgi:hypothetical protein
MSLSPLPPDATFACIFDLSHSIQTHSQRINPNCNHVSKLSHLKTLILTPNAKSSGRSRGDTNAAAGGSVGLATNSSSSSAHSCAKYMCPISGAEFNGNTVFLCVWPTGHVFSHAAFKSVGPEALQEDYGPFDHMADLVYLLPTATATGVGGLEMQRERMVTCIRSSS